MSDDTQEKLRPPKAWSEDHPDEGAPERLDHPSNEPQQAAEDGSEPPPPAEPPRTGSRLGRAIAVVLGVLAVALAIFLLLFNWDWLRGPIARMASARLHRQVRIEGHLRVHLLTWTPTATIGGIRVANPAWAGKKDMASIDRFTVSVRLLPLLRGQVIIPMIDVERPNVSLIRDASGRANWDFGGPKNAKPAKLPPIQNLVIADGHLRAVDVKRRLVFTGTINSSQRVAGGGQGVFRLAGQGTLNAKPFLLTVTGGPLINVSPNKPYPFDADVRAGDTHVTARGEFPKPFNLGLIQAAVSMTGRDLADLYYLTGLALPNTPPYSISGQLTRDEKQYFFRRFAGRVGSSDLEGDISVDTRRGRPDLHATLASRLLDFKDLGALFGVPGTSKAATPKEKAVTHAMAATGRLLPDAPLYAERIRSMDATFRYRATSVRAPRNLPLRQVVVDGSLDHGLLTIDPVSFYFPQGRLSGTLSLNARPSTPVSDIDLRVSNIALQDFFPKRGGQPVIEGVLAARAKLRGWGDTVHKAAATSDGEVAIVIPHGQVRQAFAELMGIDVAKGLIMLFTKNQQQTPLSCAVADFRVHNGVMQAQQIVFDTGVVLVNGAGDINLNSENLNFVFKGKPKKFRLFRLMAPITVQGRLTKFSFGVKPGPAIAQAGIGVALGALISPLAAVLPFIAPGTQHDANCAALLSQAKAVGAPVKVPAARR